MKFLKVKEREDSNELTIAMHQWTRIQFQINSFSEQDFVEKINTFFEII